ncbi:MAG: heavy-metal-associated domain-containing protein [Polyangiaceae bacterium]
MITFLEPRLGCARAASGANARINLVGGQGNMIELNVSGMSCGGCVASVTKAVQRLYPNAAVEVDLATGRVSVEAKDTSLDPNQIAKAIGQAGFGVEAR